MATQIRNTDPLAQVIADAHNDLKAQIGASTKFHLDASEVIPAKPNSTSLETSLALCNELIAVGRFHLADTLAHKVADAGSWPAEGAAVDLTTAETAANLMKATYNTHIADAAKHYNADATNGIAAADATTQGTLNTLLNELKTDLTAHMADAPAAKSLRVYGP